MPLDVHGMALKKPFGAQALFNNRIARSARPFNGFLNGVVHSVGERSTRTNPAHRCTIGSSSAFLPNFQRIRTSQGDKQNNTLSC